MLWRLADRPRPEAAAPFGDVPASLASSRAIAWLVEMGYASGMPNGRFRPSTGVNRAQAVSWLHAARQFDDVGVRDRFAPAVDWARYREVVTGFPDHTFRGSQPADRATTASVLWQFVDAPSAAPHPFSDVAPGDPAVSWARAAGVVSGFPDGTFRPERTVNRAQAVMMLWAIAGRPVVSGAPAFEDVPNDAWYRQGLAWASAHGIVEGFPDGTFRALDEVTRVQLTAQVSALAHTRSAWGGAVPRPSTVVFG
jgi:hypothetical protein